MDDAAFRVEHDTMGEVRVPAAARWGPQTQRAVENFPVSGRTVPVELVHALATIKAAAATVNGRLGAVNGEAAEAVRAAAEEVAAGRWDAQFPIDVFQTGSGTSTNMNVNEVVASLASERLGRPVHPNDEVNAGQSSNDTFPSAIHLAALSALDRRLLPALDHLAAGLQAAAARFADVVKAGRTHLMDATPVTLGQEFGGYAAQVELAAERLAGCRVRLGRLPLGGTAVGTGLNSPPGFARAVIDRLAEASGLPLSEAPDHFAAQGACDGLVEVSGQLRGAAVGLHKIANDLRWMGSGPRAGLAELRLPDLQPGSSIMPGKVNPVIPEAVNQVVAQVIGNDATVAFAASQGSFELITYLPVIARNLLESITLLANVARLFRDRCVDGLEADIERCRTYAESSPALATALNPLIGYEAAADLVKAAARSGRSVRELALEGGLVTAEEVDAAFDLLGQAGLHRPRPAA